MSGVIWIVLAPVARGLAGWVENALQDGTIDWPEWRKLGETIVKLGLPAAALYWGFGMDAEFVAAAVVVVDVLMSWVKSLVVKIRGQPIVEAKKK